MKRISIQAGVWSVAFGLGIAGWSQPAAAADAHQKKPAVAVSPGAPTVAPRAVFNLQAASLKDPFYPLSTRSTAPVAVVTNIPQAQVSAKSFSLSGKSGSDETALVIINDHTFAPGEKAHIKPLDGATKVGVTVLQIREFSAVIQVDGYSTPIEIFIPEKDR